MQALESAHLLPKSVHDVLFDATAAGLCGPYSTDPAGGGGGGVSSSSTFGWVLHRSSLLVWRVEDDLQATVRRLQLPQVPAGRVFVSILPHAGSTALTVVLCTASGLLCVWLDAHFFAPPYTQQLFVAAESAAHDGGDSDPDVVTAMAAGAANSAGSPGFLSVIATADGALHLYHGSQKGIFPRQFHRPSAAAASAAGSDSSGAGGGAGGSLLGSLGGVVKALYSEAFDPLYRVQRHTPSRLPARQLLLLRAGGGAGAGGSGAWRLLALAPDALDCWALGAANAASAADERLAWSFNIRGVLMGELRAQEYEPLGFTAAGGSGAGLLSDASQLLIWSAFTGANSIASQHALSVFDLRPDTIPYHDKSLVVTGAAAGALPRPAAAGGGSAAGWRVVAHPGCVTALAKAPNGAVVEWLPQSGDLQVGRWSLGFGRWGVGFWLFDVAFGVGAGTGMAPLAAGTAGDRRIRQNRDLFVVVTIGHWRLGALLVVVGFACKLNVTPRSVYNRGAQGGQLG